MSADTTAAAAAAATAATAAAEAAAAAESGTAETTEVVQKLAKSSRELTEVVVITVDEGNQRNKRIIVGSVFIGCMIIIGLVLYFTGIMKIVHTEKTPITNFQNSSDFATKDGRLMLILNNEILHKSDTISFWDKVKAVFIRYKWIIIGVVAVVFVLVWIFWTLKSRRGAALRKSTAEAAAAKPAPAEAAAAPAATAESASG